MKLLFSARAIHRMAGGVERMMSAVMNEMAARGHDVALLTWDRQGAESFYPLSPTIRWHQVESGDPAATAGKGQRLARMRAVRAVVRRSAPDLVICFQGGHFVALRAYAAGLGVPMIVAERNAPTLFDFQDRGRRWRQAMFQAFRFARAVVIQCESYRALYPAFLHRRMVTIPNPVFPVSGRARPDQPGPDGRFALLSIGRLAFQKNFPALITAFGGLASRFPEWDLVIVGDGPDRDAVLSLVQALGLDGRVSVLDPVSDPGPVYQAAHLFCLPSRWEGFPNVLAEAFSHGLPAVGFAGCAGVNELIADGVTGLLAPGNEDPEALAGALAALMENHDRRRTLGEAAPETMRAYDPVRMMDLWEHTFRDSLAV